MTRLAHHLEDRLDDAARVPKLLVACDFDGTLSDLVADPGAAEPRPVAAHAINALAALPNTLVAVVSGRSLDDLRAVAGDLTCSSAVRLFGSHGLEADDGTTIGMARSVSHDRDDLVRRVRSLAAGAPGARVEPKPYGVALHYRGLSQPGKDALLRSTRALADELVGTFTKPGKEVIELSVLPLYKPFAIDTLQHQWVPDITIYAGDDQTDEDVFLALWPGDIGIKIGDGETAAGYRAATPQTFELLLSRLGERRRAVRGRTSEP